MKIKEIELKDWFNIIIFLLFAGDNQTYKERWNVIYIKYFLRKKIKYSDYIVTIYKDFGDLDYSSLEDYSKNTYKEYTFDDDTGNIILLINNKKINLGELNDKTYFRESTEAHPRIWTRWWKK